MFWLAVAGLIVDTPASQRVRRWLQDRPDVTMLPSAALAPSVRFSSDMCSLQGADEYASNAVRWHTDASELLPPYTTTLLRCAPLGTESAVSVRWRAEWESQTLQWTKPISQLLQWQVVCSAPVSRISMDSRAAAPTRRGYALPAP